MSRGSHAAVPGYFVRCFGWKYAAAGPESLRSALFSAASTADAASVGDHNPSHEAHAGDQRQSGECNGTAAAERHSRYELRGERALPSDTGNKLAVSTAIHWHGLHPPNNEDGVPGVTQPVVRPDASNFYNFPLRPAGTHWMHSHQGLQEAFLLAAPLIVHDPADQARDEQEVVLFLSDFSFTPPRKSTPSCGRSRRGCR